jgi:cell wall-associated NlpC family hydrolase
VAALASILVVASGLAAPPARAASVAGLQAQAASLEARITALGQREAALAEQYDGAQYQLARTEARVSDARLAVASAEARASKARGVLRIEAVSAYVSGGGGAGALPPLESANQSLLRAEYEQTLASNQTDAMDQYRVASLVAASAERQLRAEERAQLATMRRISADRSQVQAAAVQVQGALSQDKGRIAQLIAQQQAAAQAAAQRAAELRIQRARAAAAATAAATPAAATAIAATPTAAASIATGTTGTAPSGAAGSSGSGGFTPPPSSSAAAIAVAAALSRVGDPYVWGAAGPNAFDCSGLVMWSYAQAGISLPHYSGAQYADTVHIPMSALQPGDLVFFSNPGQHVAMYIGNGQVVQAPYTGADVQVVPLYSGFTLASRVE